jgi:adenylate kinase
MVCDYCHSALIQRSDDAENAVINRLNTYKAQTQPLIDYYRKKNLLRVIDGNNEVDDVFKDICNVLGAEKK